MQNHNLKQENEEMENTKREYCQETYGEDFTESTRIKKTEEILDFANMVFSMEYSCTDFAFLLPKAYSPERCSIPIHHIMKEENTIKALIDMYPVCLHLQGNSERTVRAAYVGTVSVHPKARGRGYMIELMKAAEETARKQGCALMILDGDRHRYQYYGFEHAGIRYRFQIELGNITHCCANIYDAAYMAAPGYSFEKLEKENPFLDELYGLYRRRLVTARSREEFLLCLQSYGASVYVILRDGQPVGYVDLSSDRETISEIELNDLHEFPRVLYDLMQDLDVERLVVNVGMDETNKIVELEKMCDFCNACMSHQIKILDHAAVLTFLMNWKQNYSTLAISDYVMGVRNAQTGRVENYLLSVAQDQIRASRTERVADTVLEELELVRILTTSLCYVEQQKGEQSKIKNAPAGWFPLPFYLPEADTF